jgi:hypothetical protein
VRLLVDTKMSSIKSKQRKAIAKKEVMVMINNCQDFVLGVIPKIQCERDRVFDKKSLSDVTL